MVGVDGDWGGYLGFLVIFKELFLWVVDVEMVSKFDGKVNLC